MNHSTRVAWLPLAALAVVLVGSAAVGVTTTSDRQCVDPCIQAARAARRECASSAAGTFHDALDGCLERDPDCVDACRSARQDCRDATSLGSDLAACQVELTQAKQRCRNEFRPGSIRRAICIERARVDSFRCRKRAVLSARRSLRACQSAFVDCTGTCGPGSPPGGPDSCRAEARSTFDAARVACRTSFRVTTGGCLGKDITCVQECSDTRDACDAAAQAILDGAIASCNADRDAGLAACRAANPAGGQALEDCEEAVRASAFACREAAVQAAAPSFGACVTSYVGCVRTCPAI